MHNHRNRWVLLLVAVLTLLFAPVAIAQDQNTATGQQQAHGQDQLRVRDRIHVDPRVEIAHNDRVDEEGTVTHDDRLVVDTIFSSGPGWLVVYASTGANFQAQGQDADGFGFANQCGVAAAAGVDADANDADADNRDADADDQDADTGDDADLLDDDDRDDTDGDDADLDADTDADADQTVAANRSVDLATLGIVGYAHLQNGVNRGIEVPVDATRASESLCLQLYRDAGEIGVFEFPGPDSPVAGGLVITVTGGLLDEQGQLVDMDAQQADFQGEDAE